MKRWLKRIGIALLGLFAVVTLASVVYNRVSVPHTEPATALYPGPFVRLDGSQHAYRRWGTHGTPVVLVGGFAEASWVWERVAPRLARDHVVYAVDLPPFGYSERKGPYTLAAWADQVQAFQRALRLKRPLLVGHSIGAAVVAEVARRDPSSLRGIVLLDGDALKGGGGPSWLGRVLVDPYFTSLYRIVLHSDWIVRRILRMAYGPEHPPLTDALIARWVRPFSVSGTEAALRSAAGHGIAGLDFSQIQTIRIPARVVFGANDSQVPVSSGRRVAAALQAPFVVIPDAGHLALLTSPAAVAAAITGAK
ncbi:MAG TPA: alpha/beta hydrolase [Gaiellaceae bacterium]|nr:alpha/beta hydrolase [Gaiellaceae bacterium]